MHASLISRISATRDRPFPAKPSATASSSTKPKFKSARAKPKPPSPPPGQIDITELNDWNTLEDAPSFFSFDPAGLPEILAVLDFWCKPSTWESHSTRQWMDSTNDLSFGGDAARLAADKEKNAVPGCERAQYDVFGELKFLLPSKLLMPICGTDEWRATLERYMLKPTKKDGKILKGRSPPPGSSTHVSC